MKRHPTKSITIGNIKVGGRAPISVQSMAKTDTRDAAATISQIHELEEAGCEIIRVAVPDENAAQQLEEIKTRIAIPLIADIHFNHKLALMAIDAGVDGLRINPGNIGEKRKVAEVVKKASTRSIPIRIGVNAGSLEKDLLKKYGHPTPQALVASALRNIKLLESFDFDLIKVSLKASDVLSTVKAYRLIASKTHYPLHVGITEAGPLLRGAIKSSLGMGILLAEGIGDTIRVSLTAPPIEEVKVGYAILQALKLRRFGPEIISCPTCGRCEVNIERIVKELENRISHLKKPITIAVMGCVVNGPGEAREADIGIAGGKKSGLLFKKGKPLGKVPVKNLLDRLIEEINNF
ncbi:MAG TPA: flavodoxin-dependent (E)-4-hydroxy-3-methylbut-2-enyl-diphosphate synthase [Thermodesulfobacteriota bacterium]|nr:flavodoxin-dependent (E)-4-hydroxy-3-methylbut-2-enyl-diphosphate synthase [Thermodesulfobacteriota bacterium]